MATLSGSIATAQSLILANAPESATPGQHVIGALATLSGALAVAQTVTSADAQATVDAAVVTLDAAISAYNLAIVPTPPT